ncbi:MAG: hypothetical protein IPM53_10740 [Anaerolineaceae bacterium]|nr:hypothetical protein [Anaerolineaceae bacterium]
MANVRVGDADVKPDTPAHTSGVKEGNNPEKDQPGIHKSGLQATGTARRSTGINAEKRNPISDDMPNLSPA